MEALAGGAMVMTDPMHPLPYHIKEGKHVVVYRSISELQKLVKYYLEHEKKRLKIARAGYKVAMRDHRSWNIMERFLIPEGHNYWERQRSGDESSLIPRVQPQVGDEIEYYRTFKRPKVWRKGKVLEVHQDGNRTIKSDGGIHNIPPHPRYERWQWRF
jgi:spore maturation protein CgeB